MISLNGSRRYRLLLLLLFLLQGASCLLFSLDTKEAEMNLLHGNGFSRPRVALVLSGGAALGFAHVGVLKVLEEAGIPVDFVAGNSMGSLVGGLYAAGYSPGDIENLAGRINWNRIFGPVDSSDGSRLLGNEGDVLTLNFDRTGISGTAGLVDDRQLMLLISRLTYRVSMIQDFRNLTIPFKTVAVDLTSGGEMVMDRGFLGTAMRASMSIPVVFPPVEAYGGLLVDGGLLNNNPVDLAVKWGADIIIDVNVEVFRTREPREIQNLAQVADQSLKVLMNFSRTAADSAGRETIRIEPDLEGFSRLEFGRADELIARGEAAARTVLPELKALAEEISGPERAVPGDWTRRGAYFDLPEPRFSRVRMAGKTGISREYLDRLFRDLIDQPVDPRQIDRCMEELILREGYASALYRLERIETGGYGLVIQAEPSRTRAHELTLGMNFHLVSGTDRSLDARAFGELDLQGLTGPLSLWTTRMDYFMNGGFSGETRYRQPAAEYLFIQPFIQGAYRYSRLAPRESEGELATYGNLTAGTLFLFRFLDWWDFYLGYRYSLDWFYRTLYSNGVPVPGGTEDRFSGGHRVTAGTEWNASTSDPFSRAGFQGDLMVSFLLNGFDTGEAPVFPYYEEFRFRHRQFLTFPADATLWFDGEIRSCLSGIDSPWTMPSLGGRDGIPGYAAQEQIGENLVILGIGYLQNLQPLSRFLGFDSYLYSVFRMGNVWDRDASREEILGLKYGLGAGVEVETGIGSLAAGLGMALDRTWSFSLYFN